MHYRDYLQQLIYKIINPVVKGLIKMGVTPNVITTTGLVLNIVAAALFIYAGYLAREESFFYVGLGGGVVLFAGLFDMLDGRVARMGNKVSRFGAFYDSVLDRYSELFTLFGLFFFLVLQGYVAWAIVAFVALIGSIMVSYVRARAEGLGLECKVGLMQRPERVVLTSLGALFCGIFGDCTAFDPILILALPLALIALLANVTAFVRVAHCYRLFNEGK
ncbi:MAG TPA: CDP-alcohol phosphatidyltransferase family protein [Candidatus Caccoplasma merdavium]|nr:CDP-alcohol phosphatidyltransferase family protein [Candidatus Caccoplasma merdavium]